MSVGARVEQPRRASRDQDEANAGADQAESGDQVKMVIIESDCQWVNQPLRKDFPKYSRTALSSGRAATDRAGRALERDELSRPLLDARRGSSWPRNFDFRTGDGDVELSRIRELRLVNAEAEQTAAVQRSLKNFRRTESAFDMYRGGAAPIGENDKDMMEGSSRQLEIEDLMEL